MKASEYKEVLRDAIERSIKERWEILEQYPDKIEQVISCPFCWLSSELPKNDAWRDSNHCCRCPLDRRDRMHNDCGPEFEQFIRGETTEIKREAAHNLIIRIRSLDVDAWTQTLIDHGILEADA